MRERRRVKASVCCIARAGYRGAQHVLQPRDPRPPLEDTAKDRISRTAEPALTKGNRLDGRPVHELTLRPDVEVPADPPLEPTRQTRCRQAITFRVKAEVEIAGLDVNVRERAEEIARIGARINL